MTFVQLYNLRMPDSTASALKKKVTVAVSKVAMSVLTEAGNTPGHEARYRWAKNALIGAETAAEMMMWAVLGNTVIAEAGNDALDSDVEFVISSLVNTFAQ